VSTSPLPPRPPAPPVAPHKSSNVVIIALLVLALILLVSIMALWVGFRYLARTVHVQVQEGAGGKKEFSVKTPMGSMEIQGDVNEASLGLPIYPGATRVKDQSSATVDIDIGGQQSVRVFAAKFETSDPFDKVRDFYHQRLGNQLTKYVEKDREGQTILEIKHGEQEKIVALKTENGRTRIALARVIHGSGESN
jgi:hypothetical protein